MDAGESMSENQDTAIKSNHTGEKTATFKSQNIVAANMSANQSGNLAGNGIENEQLYSELLQKNRQGNVPVDQLLRQASQLRQQN